MARTLFLVATLLAVHTARGTEDTLPEKTSWGRISANSSGNHILELTVTRRPADGRLALPTPFPHIVRCTVASNGQALDFEFNEDASQAVILLPENLEDTRQILVETGQDSEQRPDGRILFSALDAKVIGETAKLESHPGNHRIGFWTNPEDYVTWAFPATRWGMYRLLLTYSTAAPDGSQVAVEFSPEDAEPIRVTGTLASTGSWYRYTTLDLGTLYLPVSGEYNVAVRCTRKVGGAVMNLKALLLVPACEGTPPKQAADGAVTLFAGDAIVQGTMLRWEPAEKKRTLGYWVKTDDQATWNFTIMQPGNFTVEVLQGCGTGQGGSAMRIWSGDQALDWTVEETGHFQNFKARTVGTLILPEAGEYELSVKPTEIARQAACDIRQIRLLPVAD